MEALMRWITVLMLCAGIFFVFFQFKFTEITQAIAAAENMPEHAETVQAAPVTTINYAPSIQVLGEAVAAHRVMLQSEVTGRIQTLNLVAGKTVQQGEVLLRLDSSEEQASLKASQARADLARSQYKRMQRLVKSQAIGQEQVDKAAADLRIVEAEIELLQAKITKQTIRAPFDAKVGLHGLELGQYLQAGRQIVELIGVDDFIWIDFKVPQFYPELAIGTQFDVRAIQANTGQATAFSPAEIVAQSPQLASSVRSAHYRARLNLADGQSLLPSTLVQLDIPTAAAKDYLAVPNSAVLHGAGYDYVYVLKPEEDQASYRAHQQIVEIVATEQQLTLLADSLTDGELVATSGAFKLYEGVLVYLQDKSQEQFARTGGAW